MSTMKEGIREGVSFAINVPAIASLLIVLIFVGTFGYNFSTVLPLAHKVCHERGTPDVRCLDFRTRHRFDGRGALRSRKTKADKKIHLRLCDCVRLSWTSLFRFREIFILTIILLVLLGMASISYIASTNTSLQMQSPMHLKRKNNGIVYRDFCWKHSDRCAVHRFCC